MTRPLRHVPVATNVEAIREHGNGEGHMAPTGRKPRTKAAFLDRKFRRHFKGIVGA